jgi:hypothetical protein
MNYMKNNKLTVGLLAAAVLVGLGTSAITIASAASTVTTPSATTAASGYGTHAKRTPPAAMGKVTAINGISITITNAKTSTTYTVDASNATVTKGGVTSATVSNIAVGDTISVAGTVSGTNVTATTIHDGFGGGRGGFGGRGGGAMGTVTAISGTTLTVTTKAGGVYTVNASSATVKESGTASAVSAIKVGDTVMIQGSITTASMTAKNIEDGVPTHPTTTTTTPTQS